jgi:hypothetical protein
MSIMDDTDSRSIVLPMRVTLRSGVRGGLFFAVAFSIIAVGRVVVGVVGLAMGDRFEAARDLPTVVRVLEFVIPGYFLGFSIAGVFFAAASQLKNRMLRYALTGLLCGAAIYSAMGISGAFIDAKAIDWREVGEIAGGLGIFFGLLGFVMGALDESRERRRRAESAAS